MDFVTAVRTCLRKYADFDGRAMRSEFWWFALFSWLARTAGDIIDGMYGWSALSGRPGLWHMGEFTLFGSLVSLLLFVPSLAVAVRRLRDTGRSAANLAWLLLPLVGWLVLAVMLADRGSEASTPVLTPMAPDPAATDAVPPAVGRGQLRAGLALLIVGVVVAFGPVPIAYLSAGPGGNMFDESRSGAALWLLFFTVPLGGLVSLVGLVLLVVAATRRR